MINSGKLHVAILHFAWTIQELSEDLNAKRTNNRDSISLSVRLLSFALSCEKEMVISNRLTKDTVR